MSIDLVQNKRAVLVAQRGQLEQAIQQMTANLNATIGAIAVCDELIAETLAEQSKAASAALVVSSPADYVEPAAAPVKMLPILHESDA